MLQQTESQVIKTVLMTVNRSSMRDAQVGKYRTSMATARTLRIAPYSAMEVLARSKADSVSANATTLKTLMMSVTQHAERAPSRSPSDLMVQCLSMIQ